MWTIKKTNIGLEQITHIYDTYHHLYKVVVEEYSPGNYRTFWAIKNRNDGSIKAGSGNNYCSKNRNANRLRANSETNRLKAELFRKTYKEYILLKNDKKLLFNNIQFI